MSRSVFRPSIGSPTDSPRRRADHPALMAIPQALVDAHQGGVSTEIILDKADRRDKYGFHQY
jgi:hypothetical protein